MLRAAAIALPRALLAGGCYGGSLLARIASKACSAYALRREWRAVVGAVDDRMQRDIGLGRSGDRMHCSGTHQPARIPDTFRPRRTAIGSMTAVGVRRDKAALSSGCKSHPAAAPAGSNRSSQGGNELAEAFGMRVTNW